MRKSGCNRRNLRVRPRPRNGDLSLFQRFLRMGASTAECIWQAAPSIPELPNPQLKMKLHRSSRRESPLLCLGHTLGFREGLSWSCSSVLADATLSCTSSFCHGTAGSAPLPIWVVGRHAVGAALSTRIALTQELQRRLCKYGLRVLSGLLRDTSHQLVQSRKQKLQDRRLVRLSVAEDQIDSRRISLQRATRHRRREKVLCVGR